ncbi:MAG: hypothetical protein ACXVLQ_14580 [Bacteriovorax sp.]
MNKKISKPSSSLSKRANEILSSPMHALGTVQGEDWSFEFTLEEKAEFQNDKILTLKYSNPSSDELRTLFLETLCRMLSQKTIRDLIRLGFREAENYLRDENHLPAFHESEISEAQECFKKAKNTLFASLLFSKIKGKYPDTETKLAWKNLGLVEKNRHVLSIIEELNKLFSADKKLALALAEEKFITLILNDFPLEIGVLEVLFHFLFAEEEGISSFKLVAAS